MRLDEMVLRIPGDELRLRFHPRLTVVAGIGAAEREALLDGILNGLAGSSTDSAVSYANGAGRRVGVDGSSTPVSSRYLDDRSPCPPLVGTLVPDLDALRSLMVLDAATVGLQISKPTGPEPVELTDARTSLAALGEELDVATAARAHQQALQDLLVEVEAKLQSAADGKAHRQYARSLADLERVRAEASALQSGANGADTDRHLLESAGTTRGLAAAWTAALAELDRIREEIGGIERIDHAALSQLRWFPEVLPTELPRLLQRWTDTLAARTGLEDRLHGLAASRLPEPSDPRIVELAAIDQSLLWGAHAGADIGAAALEQVRLDAGGLDSDLNMPGDAAVHALEDAHGRVEHNEGTLRQRFVPTVGGVGFLAAVCLLLSPILGPIMLAPMLAAAVAGAALLLPAVRNLAEARADEEQALTAAQAPSYLAFHLRRVEAAISRDIRERLDAAAMEARARHDHWRRLAGDLGLDDAERLEGEIRRYADAMAALGDTATEIESLRRDLADRAIPELAAAEADLIGAGAVYHLDAETLAGGNATMVRHFLEGQVAAGIAARAQEHLEEAEADEEKLAGRLDDLLTQLGFREGTMGARVGALDWAVERATDRELGRRRARPREVVEDDLVRLQTEVRRLRRPEWAQMSVTETVEPDLEGLEARRSELVADLRDVTRADVDLDLLVDRHSALERRVMALENQRDGLGGGRVAAIAEVEQYLFTHLNRAAGAGLYDEAVPVLLDEPFMRVGAEHKWELLDVLLRLGQRTQLVYLSDDPFVAAWARKRAGDGDIVLLEPTD